MLHPLYKNPVFLFYTLPSTLHWQLSGSVGVSPLHICLPAINVLTLVIPVRTHPLMHAITGPPPSNDVPVGEYPFIVKSDDGRSVPVVQAYAFGKYLGHLDVTFDAQGNVLHSSGNPILLNSSIPEGW